MEREPIKPRLRLETEERRRALDELAIAYRNLLRRKRINSLADRDRFDAKFCKTLRIQWP